MTRADIWVRVATGALANPNLINSDQAIAIADDVLLQFDKRFSWDGRQQEFVEKKSPK